jgi:hypothetical protein
LENNEFNPVAITQTDSPWIATADALQYADHSNMKMNVANCSLLGYDNKLRGKAFRITSALATSLSKVAVAGTAVDAIMGAVTSATGGGGIGASAWGFKDISGILTGVNGDIVSKNTLGRLLGDCSTASKTLTVTVDALAPVDIVFSTNMTAVTNATILGTINAALGTTAVADEYLVSDSYYPNFFERQRELVNTGTAGIPRWAAVKRGAGGIGMEIMGIADAASLFIGVALAPVVPGASGRVLTLSRMAPTQLLGLSAATIVQGSIISLSETTPGAFVLGSNKPVGTGVLAGWAELKGNI